MAVEIRPIEEGDIQGVIALYHKVYGDDFPFRQFYEPAWVRKGIYDDNIVWNVAVAHDDEAGGFVQATRSVAVGLAAQDVRGRLRARGEGHRPHQQARRARGR
jgi:hypothetical protein